MLSELLREITEGFSKARTEKFSEHPIAGKIRNDLKKEFAKRLSFRNEEYATKGSAGAGNWAAVPWFGFFDPLITTSAQTGFYVVYLFNIQSETISLSLNQGATFVYREFGHTEGRKVLRRRADDIRARVSDFSSSFPHTEINLGSSENLPQGYECGHALGKVYDISSLSDQILSTDLERMLDCYQTLIFRGGLLPTEAMVSEFGGKDIEETRRYTLSRRIERSPRIRKAVLSCRPAICQACGLDPSKDYRYKGSLDQTPLDVHHLKPLFELHEGETKKYKIPDDFAVLCPTCHRMIHQANNPSDVEALKNLISFKHMRTLF